MSWRNQGRPPYTSSAFSQSRLKSWLYTMEMRKLKVLSVSDMIRNSAVFLSPMVSRESSSYAVTSLSSAMSKGDRRAPQLTSMLLAVLPETSCQGLFNQIHKKATKKVPGSTFMLLTLRQAGHLRPLNSSSQRYAYSGNWSI